MNSLSYWVTNGSSSSHNHILLHGETKLCLEGIQRRLCRISIWDQSICYFVPSCSRRKLHSLLAGGESEGFGVFLSFKPKVCNAGVLGVQAVLVDCRQGSQSQWVLRVAEYQGWRTGRHGRSSSSVLKKKTSVENQTSDNIPCRNFFQCLFLPIFPNVTFCDLSLPIVQTNKMHLLSQIICSCKTLYMLRTVFPSIIRSSKLRISSPIAAGSSSCLTYTVAVYAVLSSLWWMERPSETCRAFYKNNLT